MSTLKVDTILKRTGTGTITVGQSGDTISIPSGATLSVAGSSVTAVDNTPMWYVRSTTDQTLNENAYTKIEWNSEVIDTDSAFASDKFTVPSGKAGKYYLSTGVGFYDCDAQEHHYVLFYKNGSNVSANPTGITTVADDTDRYWQTNNMIVDLAVGDYVEVYGLFSSASGDTTSTSNYSYFTGYKLIG
tara:strand:+ start:787 stop:1350 length:564 start_codon:yes stop_codon:yes gene_type:complete